MAQDAQTILNEVPKQSAGTSMKDLQFDPSTGEFRQVPRGTDPGPTGNVVTEMTDQGFAAELPLVYLDKQELVDFFESGATRLNGVAYEWEGEQVVHLHTHPTRHAHGKVSMAAFLRSGVAPHSTPTDATYSVTVDMPNADTLTIEVNDAQGNIIDNVNFIPSRDELYSRAKGILERDILAPTTVTIVGLGSFGSQIAIELAKAGVGRFKLMDFDRVELHNLARHTCTAAELGRLKTDAIADAIWGKNPYAVVERYPIDVNEHLETSSGALSRGPRAAMCSATSPGDRATAAWWATRVLARWRKSPRWPARAAAEPFQPMPAHKRPTQWCRWDYRATSSPCATSWSNSRWWNSHEAATAASPRLSRNWSMTITCGPTAASAATPTGTQCPAPERNPPS